MTNDILSATEAAHRIRTDHDILLARVADRTEAELKDAHRVQGGPLGDFCESLHDLVAHVLMWDEIDLAVLQEARSGREHWSIDPRWETAESGRALNRAGVAAGREFPGHLLLDRLTRARDALLEEIDGLAPDAWDGPTARRGALAQQAMTVPGSPAYWHAALHLQQLPTLDSVE